MNEGVFVLVKTARKKSVNYYFIAEVLSCGDNNDLRYRRRIVDANKFVNDAPEIYYLLPEDIERKLPKSHNAGETARCKSSLVFDVQFDGSNVK